MLQNKKEIYTLQLRHSANFALVDFLIDKKTIGIWPLFGESKRDRLDAVWAGATAWELECENIFKIYFQPIKIVSAKIKNNEWRKTLK